MFALALLSEEGPNATLSWLLWLLLAAFAAIVVIGWLVSRKKPAAPATRVPAHGGSDDLTIIEGIGPKVAAVLKTGGIQTFADLAGADVQKVEELLKQAGLHMMNPAGWIEQAALAAKGDWDALKKLQAELTGGRRA